MLTVTELDNGDLEIAIDDTASDEDIQELQERSAIVADAELLSEFTEHYWTNGSYRPFDAGDANPSVGLTDAPCIAESIDYEDDGTATVVGKLWWFPNYQVESPVETLINKRRVVFTLAPIAGS